ncbi:hypothetical protein SERLA73DRAFT_127646 [Serpula lacrymans var. lacrymans S7.3]|uniref:Uncharacterized protein n=1 Tax=Serpula lacrymans var. lacrymans (strain S7.3) TaxID=936435 RepID=F8QHE4_SERL3|nr:hypothetical protein SERLA73DRAFT_127646 [Serpula lacrymans var. lacrymans S7.3]
MIACQKHSKMLNAVRHLSNFNASDSLMSQNDITASFENMLCVPQIWYNDRTEETTFILGALAACRVELLHHGLPMPRLLSKAKTRLRVEKSK